jgi:predicted nucleic acid-binding protein
MFLTGGESTDPVQPRAPQSDDSRRRVEHIALAELKAGVLVCAELLYGAGRDDLISETARQFGFRRTGKDIASRIGKAIDQLLQAGKLAGDAEMLTIAD